MTAGRVRESGLRVAELAAEVGLTSDTIRYYERAGLLPAPARTTSGYRAYEASAVERLRFVQGAQRLGLRLKDIADLLAIRDTGTCPCEPAEQLLRRRLAEVDVELARLAALREQMAAMLAALPNPDECPPMPTGTWCPPTQPGEEVNSCW
jgi:DNA-binding transcriptional MerR regulator